MCAAVAAMVVATVAFASHHAYPPPVREGAGRVTVTSAPLTMFSFQPIPGRIEYAYPVNGRQVLPPLSGPRLGGSNETLQLSDLAGAVVVINIWGSWCAPCRSEVSRLSAAYAELSPADVHFLGVDIKDNAAAAKAIKLPYPSIFDPAQRTAVGTFTASVPTTIVLDKQHRVAHIWLEPITQQALTETVRRILEEQ